MLLLPNSPRWLVCTGKIEEAHSSLRLIYSKVSAKRELDTIIVLMKEMREKVSYKMLLSSAVKSVLFGSMPFLDSLLFGSHGNIFQRQKEKHSKR